jgi:hypothetical protein
MSSSAEPNPKQSELSSQSSQAMSATNELAIDKVKGGNTNRLLKWIQQNLNNPLDDDKEAFSKAKIDGEAFLCVVGAVDFFIVRVSLSPGASQKLAQNW